MEDHPKSFWGEQRDVDPEQRWISSLDGTGLREEADIIRATTRAGIPLPVAEQYELWELAAACNLDLIETWADHDAREIVAKSEAYWEETKTVRTEKLGSYREKRKQRELERRLARRGQVT